VGVGGRIRLTDHIVYIVRCSTGDLYTGYTLDLERRLKLHNRGKASKFTRSRRPVRLVHIERFNSKSEALRREISIKRMARREKLRLIRSRDRRTAL